MGDFVRADDALIHLNGLAKLATLKLGKTRITGAGLAHLTGLAKLSYLDLCETAVTDEALAQVARLLNLRALLFNGTLVTSRGMRHLQSARRLNPPATTSVILLTVTGLPTTPTIPNRPAGIGSGRSTPAAIIFLALLATYFTVLFVVGVMLERR